MSMFSAFNINASGMTAQRYRMDILAENVANAYTTRTADGTPYRRKVVAFAEKSGQTHNQTHFSHVLDKATHDHSYFSHALGQADHSHSYAGLGVKVSGVYEDYKTEMNMVYDPSHPDADENGYVTYPNVNMITEMTNLIDASRSFEANTTAFEASKNIAQQGLQIGRS